MGKVLVSKTMPDERMRSSSLYLYGYENLSFISFFCRYSSNQPAKVPDNIENIVFFNQHTRGHPNAIH